MTEFHPLEWNMLVNRARATLKAQQRCAGAGALCRKCPMAGGGADRTVPPGEACCRSHFRATELRLARLVRNAPPRERRQLRRTLDTLALTYRSTWPQGACHA
ncbi:MAG TPA: hypothetical protein VKA48_06420 [Gammaproteobacteria bacterium]|nr:hypothetical protein [Gammaproteobacteria bacterium]